MLDKLVLMKTQAVQGENSTFKVLENMKGKYNTIFKQAKTLLRFFIP